MVKATSHKDEQPRKGSEDPAAVELEAEQKTAGRKTSRGRADAAPSSTNGSKFNGANQASRFRRDTLFDPTSEADDLSSDRQNIDIAGLDDLDMTERFDLGDTAN